MHHLCEAYAESLKGGGGEADSTWLAHGAGQLKVLCIGGVGHPLIVRWQYKGRRGRCASAVDFQQQLPLPAELLEVSYNVIWRAAV